MRAVQPSSTRHVNCLVVGHEINGGGASLLRQFFPFQFVSLSSPGSLSVPPPPTLLIEILPGGCVRKICKTSSISIQLKKEAHDEEANPTSHFLEIFLILRSSTIERSRIVENSPRICSKQFSTKGRTPLRVAQRIKERNSRYYGHQKSIVSYPSRRFLFPKRGRSTRRFNRIGKTRWNTRYARSSPPIREDGINACVGNNNRWNGRFSYGFFLSCPISDVMQYRERVEGERKEWHDAVRV